MDEDICHASATDLAHHIRRGDLSPVAVVDEYLARIEERNDVTNAYVRVFEDQAREAAREAERAVETTERLGPLHGVPIAIKDLEDVAGAPTTDGSKPLADNVAEDDAPFVRRLRDAGAIIIGKTNTPEFGHKGTTDNLLFGPTSTPFDPDRNAGGSSGGSAAAVADGLVPLAQGSDGGGSVRIPSAWCGVVGFKSTYRRIARPATPDAFTHTPFSQLGPHARTVEDAALFMDVLSGPGDGDPMVAPDDGTDYRAATKNNIAGFKVAFSPDLDIFPVEEYVRETVADATDAFKVAGATVDRVDIDFGHSREEVVGAWRGGFAVKFAALADQLAESHGIDYEGADRADTSPEFVELIEEGRAFDAVEYKRLDEVRTAVFRELQSVLGDYDLLVTPTLATLPVANNPDRQTLGPREVNGEAVDPLIGWCLTYPLNMTGHPALTVPAGTVDGLPVGMQIIGRRWADDDVLAAGAAFERVRPWDDLYPPGGA